MIGAVCRLYLCTQNSVCHGGAGIGICLKRLFFLQQNRHSLGVRCQEATAEHAADTNAVGVGEQLHVDVAHLTLEVVDAFRNAVAGANDGTACHGTVHPLRCHVDLHGNRCLLAGVAGGERIGDQLNRCRLNGGAAEPQFDLALQHLGGRLEVAADDLRFGAATVTLIDLFHVHDLAVGEGELHGLHTAGAVVLLPGIEQLYLGIALDDQLSGEN